MRNLSLLLAALILAPLGANAQETVLTERADTSRTGNWYVTDRSAQQLGTFIDDRKARIVDLDIASTNPLRFDASLVSNSGSHASGWWWLFGQTEAQLNAFLDEKNARIIDLETYRVGNRRLFAAVMKPNKGADKVRWEWRFGMSRDGMVNFYNEHNFRLVDIERYRENGRTRFAAVMVDNTGARKTDWFWFRNQTLQGLVRNMNDKKMRVLDVERHGTGSNTRFTTILVPYSPGQRAWHYYNISGDDVTHMALRHGSRITDLERRNNGRFDVQLLDNGYPRDGHCGGRLRHFSQGLRDLMKRHAIPAGQIAVVKDQRLVLSCAYGLSDIDAIEPATPQNLFRVMSVSKLLTLSAIRHLEGAGELDRDDLMIDALGNRAPNGPFADNRMNDISVQNLMDMDGGFVASDRYDPMVDQFSAAEDMGQATPLTCRQIMVFAITDFDLSFDPGVFTDGNTGNDPAFTPRQTYSNLGYCILAQIVRATSGQGYQNYVRDQILKPAGVTAMVVGRGREASRKDGEVAYYDEPFKAPRTSPYSQDSDAKPRPYTYVVEAMAGHGGWLASANDLVRYAAF
ncbi:MAG: serine hydrolase, partial [Pseudomonadota bacterium]